MKSYQLWTNQMLSEEALKFKTKFEFKKQSAKAYDAAYSRKILKEICAHMDIVRTEWNLQSIQDEALKYSAINEFRMGSSAYQAARKRGIVALVTSHMAKTRAAWTDEMLSKEAKRFETRADFKVSSQAAYLAATRRNQIDLICAHMTPQRETWNILKIQDEAKKYISRADFERGSPNAYHAAVRNKMMDDVSLHMENRSPTDNDAIYIWCAVGAVFNGNKVYKVGITSSRLSDNRVKMVAKKAGFKAEIIALHKVSRKASEIECELLSIGERPMYEKFDGHSEFRAMSHEDLARAVEVASRWRCVDSD